MKARTALAVAALVAMAAAVAAIAAGRSRLPRDDPRPSTEASGPRGAAALHDWLAATGRAPLRVAGPSELPPGAVAVLAAPEAALSPGEIDLLLDRAAAGGLVILAVGRPGSQPELERRLLLSRPRTASGGAEPAAPLAPHPLFAGLTLSTSGASVASGLPGALPVAGGLTGALPAAGSLAAPGGIAFAAAVSVPQGRGELLLLAGPELLENARIGEADNLLFWARLAARGRLAFDEGHWAAPARPKDAASGRLLPLALQLLAAAGLLLWALARRLGAIRPPPAGASRTAADYLASLAALYRGARAEPELAAGAWRAHRLRLQRRAGIAAALPDAEATLRLAALRPEAAPAFREAAALAAGGVRSPAALQRLVAGLARVEVLVERRPDR